MVLGVSVALEALDALDEASLDAAFDVHAVPATEIQQTATSAAATNALRERNRLCICFIPQFLPFRS